MSFWIRSGALVGAPHLIEELGGDAAALTDAAGLDMAAWSEPEFPVQAPAAVRFLEAAAAACQCEHFGLRLAQRQDMSLLGPLWGLVQSAATAGDMLHDIARTFPLHTRGALISLESSAAGLIWNYNMATGIGVSDRQATELGIAVVVTELRTCNPSWRPQRVFFRHSAPRDVSMHRQVFGPHVSFNADRNAIFIDADMLASPYGSGDSVTRQALATRFNVQRKQLPGLVKSQTETVIRALISAAPCDIVTTASLLHLSTRSLRRHLMSENTSFSAILAEVRADLALKYLSQSELPVADIAEILGFSETSALTRAFRRWYGHSPREVRRGLVI